MHSQRALSPFELRRQGEIRWDASFRTLRLRFCGCGLFSAARKHAKFSLAMATVPFASQKSAPGGIEVSES